MCAKYAAKLLLFFELCKYFDFFLHFFFFFVHFPRKLIISLVLYT